ncbi:hypothetical protein ABF87_05195 [Nitrosomonas sp. JL21]|uniref:hypothetical protein n=1 Tax=Nitrosomonas sp. JL21 TaxID=153949 RepID=UPI00136AD1F9|nr:hypothetical protein [Nitrosomonas sp. JL21]MBL8496362.1 hypothetical protein [Nitrosomonas sp.]MXS77364.1 hypothetical protein [Nitrosomonas sp. JL21]
MTQALWTILGIVALMSSAVAGNPASTGHDSAIRTAQAMLTSGDYAQAFDLYHAAAVNGHHPLAQFTLAQFYQHGWGRGR